MRIPLNNQSGTRSTQYIVVITSSSWKSYVEVLNISDYVEFPSSGILVLVFGLLVKVLSTTPAPGAPTPSKIIMPGLYISLAPLQCCNTTWLGHAPLNHDDITWRKLAQVPQGGYGEDQQVRFLIMSRLGPDVEAAQTQNGPWSISRMAGYARQMLSLLRVLHEKCKMVFVDVKPGERRTTIQSGERP